MSLNPQHLLTFAVVARLKSITLTAQHLHIGQPAVSGQLKLLQTFVGEPLYERKGHQIELTVAGEGAIEHGLLSPIEMEFDAITLGVGLVFNVGRSFVLHIRQLGGIGLCPMWR